MHRRVPVRFVSLTASSNVGLYKDSYHYSHLLQSHSGARALKQIHAQIVAAGHAHNQFLAAKLVSRYADLGCPGMADARLVFDRTLHRDVLLWNVMIRGYANSGPQSEAVALYAQLRRSFVAPNCFTYPFLIKACAAMGDENVGRAVHANVVKGGFDGDENVGRAVHANVVKGGFDGDLFVGNALVAFYAKCGEVDVSRRLFDEMPERDLVSWNSMIAGYSQSDHAHEAVALFHRMLRDERVHWPDHVTLVALLPACSALAAIQEGLWIHSYVIKSGMPVDDGLGSGLISMYASCGRLDIAHEVFNRVAQPNLIVYNSLIRGYGTHGHGSEALEIFSKMLMAGVEPDGICFVSVLSACSHAGMVQKGFEIFEMMSSYGVEKGQVHYACMVDLLGRAGHISRALEFIRDMPVEPQKDVWGALLGACRIHNHIELAEEVANRLFLLDPANAGRYSALAGMYEDLGRWQDAARLRKTMRDRGVRKPIGCSMVEVDTELHTFGVEDKSHPQTPEIYVVLKQLHKAAKEEII